MVASVDIVKPRGRTNSCLGCFSRVRHDPDDPSCHSHRSAASEDHHRKSVIRTFSTSLKALFFKTTLVKKIRSKRHQRDSTRSNRIHPSTKSKTSSIKSKEKMTDDLFITDPGKLLRDTTSDQSSLFTSTPAASASSISTDSRSGSDRMPDSAAEDFRRASTKNKLKQTVRRVGNLCNYKGLCLFLICLAALLFLGRSFPYSPALQRGCFPALPAAPLDGRDWPEIGQCREDDRHISM